MLTPENKFLIEVNVTEIRVTDPDGRLSTMDLGQIEAVYVETNDTGPWGADVWYVLVDVDGVDRCVFPQGATNYGSALALLSQLEGFEIRGMNSVENMRHLCWQRESN